MLLRCLMISCPAKTSASKASREHRENFWQRMGAKPSWGGSSLTLIKSILSSSPSLVLHASAQQESVTFSTQFLYHADKQHTNAGRVSCISSADPREILSSPARPSRRQKLSTTHLISPPHQHEK